MDQIEIDMNFSDMTFKVDQLIKDGDSRMARIQLSKLVKNELTREEKAEAALLARRVSQHSLALRLLNPIVRPSKPLLIEADQDELLTYASALVLSGSQNEGLNILNSLSSVEAPNVLLYKSFAHIRNWNYGSAIPLLERYCRKDISSYQILVGQINLASSYLFQSRYEQTDQLLNRILETSSSKERLVKIAAYQLLAQSQINQNQWLLAIKTINAAKKIYNISSGINYLLMEKWFNIASLYLKGKSEIHLANLDKIKIQAKEQNHWETLRDCDFYIGLIEKNEETLNKVYHGTPYSSFRNRMMELTNNEFSPKEHYQHNLAIEGISSSGPLIKFDFNFLNDCHLLNSPTNLLLLQHLTSDLYKPSRIGTLHDNVFPNEYFNPFSSENRVSQLVHRFNKWTKGQGLSLTITVMDGYYHLAAQDPTYIQLGKGRRKSPLDIKLDHLKNVFTHRSFTAAMAATQLNCSTDSAQKLLNQGISSSLVKAHGNTRSRTYRL